MTLTLAITNRDRLENGSPTELVLHNRGAIIGRAQTCEWPLPDDARVLSGRHCEVQFRDGTYTLVDSSTNGTFLGNEPERMAEPRRIRHGDRFRIGPFEIEARLSGEARARFDEDSAASAQAAHGPSWSEWDDFPGGAQPPPAPAADPFAQGSTGGWDMPEEDRGKVSAWADRAGSGPSAPSADQIFNSLTDNHKVDWTNASWDVAPGFDPFAIPASASAVSASGGSDVFGSATSQDAASDPFGGPLNDRERAHDKRDPFAPLSPAQSAPFPPSPPPQGAPPAPATFPVAEQSWPATPRAAQPSPAVPDQSPSVYPTERRPAATPLPDVREAPRPEQADVAYRELITALGIPSSGLTEAPGAIAGRAGRMLRRLLAGLMILLEARARAKDEMGASATQLRFEGNNPLKFARNVEQALQMMMNPALQGYMDADLAIEDSYRDLQAHQIATLRAMQGALRATLQRFSPTAIKARAGEDTMLRKIVPGQREAALWRAYEKQFSGVAEGSAEAFLDIFSKEFRQAYEDAARGN